MERHKGRLREMSAVSLQPPFLQKFMTTTTIVRLSPSFDIRNMPSLLASRFEQFRKFSAS